MKLYTESKVKRMMQLARETYASESQILLSFEPIKLPSDEEIFSESLNHKEPDDFNCGSQFIIDYIKSQNK